MSRAWKLVRLAAATAGLVALTGSPAAGATFRAGAASIDITPPPYTAASDAAFVPALQQLLASAPGSKVEPGLYLDAGGRLSDSPFASASFGGAVGVEVVPPSGGAPQKLLLGRNATGWATFDALPDPGTAGTSLPYSVRTAGVVLNSGRPLLVDVFAGARALPH
ncbi:MAG TPA: hypothetical protein VGN08_06980 [Solirubrobacteraceae bacterium]|jgi:hypothetical protein